MNFKALLFSMLACLSLVNVSAFADPRIDLFPKALRYVVGQREFSNEKFLNVYIDVTAGGNVAFNNRTSMKVLLKNRFFTGRVYAPVSRGGVAGGPIMPGETGVIALEVPFSYLARCENVLVHIDVNQNMQYGPSVFSNDQGTFQVTDAQLRLPCILRPLSPVRPDLIIGRPILP